MNFFAVTSRPNQTGLTLVEVLIALVLLTALVGILFNGLNLFTKSWQKMSARLDENQRWRLVSQFLHRELSSALPLRHGSLEHSDLLFDGDPHTLQFVGPIPSHFSRGGPHLIRLSRETVGEHYQLVFSYTRLAAEPNPLGKDLFHDHVYKTILLDDLHVLEFSYFGNEQPSYPNQWHDDWISDSNLPRLVKIRLATNNSERGWPEITIPIHARGVVNLPQLQMKALDGSDGSAATPPKRNVRSGRNSNLSGNLNPGETRSGSNVSSSDGADGRTNLHFDRYGSPMPDFTSDS